MYFSFILIHVILGKHIYHIFTLYKSNSYVIKLYNYVIDVRCGAGWIPDLHTPIHGDNKNIQLKNTQKSHIYQDTNSTRVSLVIAEIWPFDFTKLGLKCFLVSLLQFFHDSLNTQQQYLSGVVEAQEAFFTGHFNQCGIMAQ